MRESARLEFKESVSSSFLKTVSAFANYRGGSILFGVNDTGEAIGLADPVQACLDIENKINDTIAPQPEYALEVHEADATVRLTVEGGRATPYLYKSKAYKRNDSATIEVDGVELTRLLLAGKNIGFEQLPSQRQNLTFECLAEALKKQLGLAQFDNDTLKTLGLLSDEAGYNNAASILADSNECPGIDIAQFGDSVNVILRRVTCEGVSVLSSFDAAMQVFEDCYCYEKVVGARRQSFERIPKVAFREALANAIVHRTWDVSARIRISMFDDRVEVASPGGLPTGISEDEYLSDRISVRRNPVLANVFYRLGVIETFGTGIFKIKDAYEGCGTRPQFDVRENSITVTLPLLKEALGLSPDQELVYELLGPTRALASSELHAKVDFSRSKLNGILKELIARGLVTTQGAGRSLKYKRT